MDILTTAAAFVVERWDLSASAALVTTLQRTAVGRGMWNYTRLGVRYRVYHRYYVPRKKARDKYWRVPHPARRWAIRTKHGTRYIGVYPSKGKRHNKARGKAAHQCLMSMRSNPESSTFLLMSILRYAAWTQGQDDLVDAISQQVRGAMLCHKLGVHDDNDIPIADFWRSDFPRMRLVFGVRHGVMVINEFENHRETINHMWAWPGTPPDRIRDVFINMIGPGLIEISRMPRLKRIIPRPLHLATDDWVTLGVDLFTAQFYRIRLGDIPNLIALGETRSGKSEWEKMLISILLDKIGTYVEQVIFCNPTSAPGFRQYIRKGLCICEDLKDIDKIVDALLQEFRERVARTPTEVSTERAIYLIVDEFANIRKPSTIAAIEDLARNGLKMNIHVIIANQRGTDKDVPRGIRDNAQLACFRTQNQITFTQGFNRPMEAFRLTPDRFDEGDYVINLPGKGLKYLRATLETRVSDVDEEDDKEDEALWQD